MAARERRVVWTAQAEQMLDDAVLFIAQDSHDAAVRFLADTLETAASLKTMSERGRVVPEFGLPDLRELIIKRYRLIYEVRPLEIRILAFLHGARDIKP